MSSSSFDILFTLYQGNATKFLKVCAEMPCFVTATGGSVKSERMLDREFVLRFVSFCYLDLNKYTGNIDEFLNLGMKYNIIRSRWIYKIHIDHRLIDTTLKRSWKLFIIRSV